MSPDKDGELDLNVSRAPLADTITWLPAIEHRGEGVFISFNPSAIDEWVARDGTTERGHQIESAWRQWAKERMVKENRFPGLPYIMLHSLSHMLMTSIALECGYPASSLRERVYAGDGGYGILIYTGRRTPKGRSEGWSRRDGASRSTLSAVSGTICSARTTQCAQSTSPTPRTRRGRSRAQRVTAAS